MFPWHHRWNVLAFTLLSQAMIWGILTFSFPFWIVPWLDEFQAPRSQLMLIISLQTIVAGLISPFCGIALDKYRPRWTIGAGAVFFAIGLLLISMARSHWEILILYVALSFSAMFCGQLGCQALVSRWFTSNRGTALGISALGTAIGGFLMPPISTAMLASFGWRETFLMLSIAVLVLLVPAVWIILGKDPEQIDPEAKKDTGQAAAPTRWTTAQLLRNRDFWIVVICFCALLMAYLPATYSLGVYAMDLGIPQQRAAWIASVGAIALGVGKFAFGRLADKFELQWLYWGAGAGILASIIVVCVAGSWLPLMVAVALLSFCFGAYVPLLSVTVVNRFGAASFGQVLGLILMFTQLGTVAPYIAGLLQELSGSYVVAFIAMASPVLIAMIAMRSLSVRPAQRS